MNMLQALRQAVADDVKIDREVMKTTLALVECTLAYVHTMTASGSRQTAAALRTLITYAETFDNGRSLEPAPLPPPIREPLSDSGEKPVKIEDALTDAVRRALAVGHRTCWMGGGYAEDTHTGVQSNVFAFVSWHNETARRAQALLKDAGLLCDTDLGRVGFEPPVYPARLSEMTLALIAKSNATLDAYAAAQKRSQRTNERYASLRQEEQKLDERILAGEATLEEIHSFHVRRKAEREILQEEDRHISDQFKLCDEFIKARDTAWAAVGKDAGIRNYEEPK